MKKSDERRETRGKAAWHCIGILLLLVACHWSLVTVSHAERIKDIANFEGMRENQLIGYGLVVGLNGTGDKGNQTIQSVANLLRRMGMTVTKKSDFKIKNAAAVMVTAALPPFPKPGMRLDCIVSAIGDAKSLQGGTLLLAPLKGPDDKVYALAQGAVSVGGFIGGGGGDTAQKNHTAAGKVPGGVTIESEPPFKLGAGEDIRLFLHRPDFTTAAEITHRINEVIGADTAVTVDPTTVRLRVPGDFEGRMVELIAIVEGIDVTVDNAARVVINERTGTVTIGENVRISPVAIAHGSLTIEIRTETRVSQPPPLAPEGARTVVTQQREVAVKEQNASLMQVSGTTLGEVVRALNALGVTPRDLVSILQALRAAGALRAHVEII